MIDALAEAERAKYERVWAECPLYGRASPGLRHAPEAFEWFLANGCESLVDAGCGDGRALTWFREAGVTRTLGLDIAAVERLGGEHQVWRQCLWHTIHACARQDFLYCCDVLEHIPPPKVDDVLRELVGITRVAGWFQIALFPDTAGTVGEWGPLHLTLEPPEWWKERVERAGFEVVKDECDGKRLKLWLVSG